MPPLPSSTDVVARARRSFAGRCVLRFIGMQGIDRSVVLSSQAFTALIPLLILATLLAPAGSEDRIAQVLIRRFALEGDGAAAVTLLFDIPEGAAGGVSVVSAVLLLASGTSFARRMQAMYRAAWDQEKAGVRGGLYAVAGLLVLVMEVAVLYGARSAVRHLPMSWALTVPVSFAVGVLLWTSIPYVLLNRRVHWRRLLAGGTVAALGTTAYSLVTTLYMPALMKRYTAQFGLFGITIALLGWLLAIAGVLLASAAIGAEFDASEEPWVAHLKQRLGLRDPWDPAPRRGEAR